MTIEQNFDNWSKLSQLEPSYNSYESNIISGILPEFPTTDVKATGDKRYIQSFTYHVSFPEFLSFEAVFMHVLDLLIKAAIVFNS